MSTLAVLGVVYLTVSVLLALLCAVDMDRRGHRGEMYAVVVLFVVPLGVVLWGLDRRRPPPA